MKKLLLTTALVGVAFVASPAMAEVELGLGGHFKGYVTWHDQDNVLDVAGNSNDNKSFDILRETEIHFTGETTLDNGLTVGFHAEAEADGADGFEVEESYAYFAGNWGRVNFGAEDGAAYLLQVAAPSADSNIDGIRQYVNPITQGFVDGDLVAAGFQAVALPAVVLDYDQAQTGYADKITYITPVFNGFQAAASYTPSVGSDANSFGNRFESVGLDDAWEGAVRYEGQFNAVRLTVGGGYTHVSNETTGAGFDDVKGWNLGTNVGFGPVNVGAAYVREDNAAGVKNDDETTWVIGADYTTGPWVIGASYLDKTLESTGVSDDDITRYSGGVTYTYGPGMTFRGSVHHAEYDANTAGVSDFDATSLLLGTQINF